MQGQSQQPGVNQQTQLLAQTQSTSTEPFYSYCVKLINPARKKDSITRELRKFHGRFRSVMELKVRLMEEFEDQVPDTTKFSLGYMEGKQSTKRWICTEGDLNAMYTAYACSPQREIMLWCDSRESDDNQPRNKKRKTGDTVTKREETEQRVLDMAEELKEMHKEKMTLSEVQYRLWARMLVTGIHSSKDNPPQVPMITGGTPRRPVGSQKNELEQGLISTAATIVKAAVTQNSSCSSIVQSPHINQTVNDGATPPQRGPGVSPGKVSEIRGKCYAQLATLKHLYEDDVLTSTEFEEQKEMILSGLKKLY